MFKRWCWFKGDVRRAGKYKRRGEWNAVRWELYYAVRRFLTGKEASE